MAADNLGDKGNALCSGDVWQANEPCVRDAMKMDQLTEVRVDGDEDSLLRLGEFQDSSVPGISSQRADLDNVVSAIAQVLRQAAPGAPVDEKPHESPTAIVARVSLAITACA